MNERVRVAVVYGGRSSEHSISMASAASVLAALDPQRYETVPVGIDPGGRWLLTGASPQSLQIVDRSLPEVDKGTAVLLSPDPTTPGLRGVESGEVGQVLAGIDVVFPLLHGRFGEDGTIQGLFEMAGVPYVGSGVFASAAGMDKEYTKILCRAAGLDVGEFSVLRRGRPFSAAQLRHLGLPVFVKPARAGSSVGISKVRDWADLAAALELAFSHDEKVLVEAAVAGHEVECGVLEGDDGSVQASPPAEIVFAGEHDWYDFDTKYLEDACAFEIPAKLAPGLVDGVRKAACTAFEALDCAGLARVDFFVTDDGRVILNEINTMPGFTSISMFPKMWAAAGVDYPTLVDRLIRSALRRAGR